METKNPIFKLTSILVMELKDVVFFPLWWYTGGLFNVVIGIRNFIANSQKSLAFLVWARNIFTPMYGQRDWQGFLVSVLIRSVQVFFRGFAMIIVLLLSVIFFIFWLIIPIIIFHQILFQLGIVKFNLFL